MLKPSLDRKLIQIFVGFVEKALVPQIRKYDGSLAQWSKFCSLLSNDSCSHSDLQNFIDAIPGFSNSLTPMDKYPLLNKKTQSDVTEVGGFNPSKTFGGERNRYANLDPEPADRPLEAQKEDPVKQRVSQVNNSTLSSLQKLLRNVQENQSIIESLLTRQPTRQAPKQQPKQQNMILSGRQSSREPTSAAYTNGMGLGSQMPGYSYVTQPVPALQSNAPMGGPYPGQVPHPYNFQKTYY